MAPGQVISGRYRLQERIARGGQASVWRAEHIQLERPVALKILLLSQDMTEDELAGFRHRFLLEARTLAALDHPHIVRIFDYGEIGREGLYIAMEYVRGRSFNSVLRERPLPARGIRLIHQVCQALRYAHHRGVVHRDIKNSNVMVTRDEDGHEQAKVVDFGIAKVMDDRQEITRVGVVLGSPHFMAPEQAQGIPLDHRADIYAVGVLMYCVLAGRYPYTGDTPQAIVAGHLVRPLPPFSTLSPPHPVPEGIEPVVRRCLEKDPADRYPDMDKLLADLDPFVEGLSNSLRPQVQVGTLDEVQPGFSSYPGLRSGEMATISAGGLSTGTTAPPAADARWGTRLLILGVGVGTALLVSAIGLGLILSMMPGKRPVTAVAPPPAAVIAPLTVAPPPPVAEPEPDEAAEALAEPVAPVIIEPPRKDPPARPVVAISQPAPSRSARSEPARAAANASTAGSSRPSAENPAPPRAEVEDAPVPPAVQPVADPPAPPSPESGSRGTWTVEEVRDPWGDN